MLYNSKREGQPQADRREQPGEFMRCEECGLLISGAPATYEALTVCVYCLRELERYSPGPKSAWLTQNATPRDDRPDAFGDVEWDDGTKPDLSGVGEYGFVPDFQLGFRNLDPLESLDSLEALEWVEFDAWLAEHEDDE